MKYYRHVSGEIYAYDENQDPIDNLTPMSDEEVAAHLNPAPSDETRIGAIKVRLFQIDAESIRPLRAGETDRLAQLEAEAEALRLELRGLEGA